MSMPNLNVQKANLTNELTGPIVVPSGESITATGTGQIVATASATADTANAPTDATDFGGIDLTLVPATAQELETHEADTSVHGATSSPSASRIVLRDSASAAAFGGVDMDISTIASAYKQGRMRWNATDKCVEYDASTGTTIQIGQEVTIRARNNTGMLIANGKPVYISGATGNRPTIALAKADTAPTAQTLIGLVTEDSGIADNADGFVTVFGLVRDLNTNSFTAGDTLYLSDATAGGLTATKPTTEGSYVVRVGFVTVANPSNGEILVSPHYMGSVTGNAVMSAVSKSAARTAINLGNVDNTSDANKPVSTATQTALDAKADMPRIERRQNLRNFFKALSTYAAAPSSTRICVGYYGDSVASGVGGEFANALMEGAYIKGDLNYPGSNSSALTYTASGLTYEGSTTPTPDFTYFPSAQHNTIGNGGYIEFDCGQSVNFNEIRAYLVTGPGMGSAFVEVINRGTAAVVTSATVDCSGGASLGATKAGFTGLSQAVKYKIRITATGQIVNLLTIALRPNGVVTIQLCRGGSTFAQNNSSNATIFQYVCNDLGVSLIFVQAKEENPTVDIPLAFIRLGLLTNADKFIIGSLPDVNGTSAATNSIFRSNAATFGYPYFDGYAAFGSYAANAGYTELVRLAWQGDGIHSTAGANKFVASLIMGELAADRYFGNSRAWTINQQLGSNGTITSSQFYIPTYDATGTKTIIIDAVGAAAPTQARLKNIYELQLGSGASYPKLISYGVYGISAQDQSGAMALFRVKNLESTVATGTAPLTVASTTRVANLNVATAGTADTLTTARTINGTSFNGSANITVTAAADTLTGTTLASGVTASSLTSAAGGSFGTAAYTAATAYTAAPVAAPATATSTGTAGQWAYDAGYIYVCVATNTWVRSALSTW